jgi:hypothetical protein
MARRLISGSLSMALVLGMIVCMSSAPKAFRDNPCDGENHGPYTTTLCPGEHLVPNGYLVNYPYILWFSNLGALDLYDITDSEHWELITHFFDGFDNPSVLDNFVYSQYEGCLCAWDPYEIQDGLLWSWLDPGDGPDGDWFFELSSDGNLRVFDQGGNREVACGGGPTSC